MKTGFFSSIRFRSYLLYVVVLGVALFFHNTLTYVGFRETLLGKVDELLAAKAEAVESTLRTYHAAQQSAASYPLSEPRNWFSDLFGNGSSNSDHQKRTDEPYDTVLRYLTRDRLSTGALEARMAIDIYGLDGQLLESTRGPKTPRLEPAILKQALKSEKGFYTTSFKSNGVTIPIRAMAMQIYENGQPKNIVQTRIPLQSIHEQLHWFVVQLLLRSLVVIALASGGGFILVKFTLRPVDRMTREIRNIKPDNLDRRLCEPGTDDEIARLAETFNEMLGRLEKSFKSQRQIVQDISHELKTPLTIMRGQIEVALKKKRSIDEYEEILQSSLEETQKVRRIVDNLLLLAKFDNPGHSMNMKSVDLKSLLEEILHDTRINCIEKKIDVSFSATRSVLVRGNDVHLDRLFRNLLENAAKYNVPNGRIDVSLEEDRANAWVTIHDTGIGIADPEVEKVFDRFYRVDPARSSREGFGLGLSIVKSIIDAHGGRVQVHSAAGQGTTFRVALPLGKLSSLSY